MKVILHTNFGDIKIKLYPERTPITVENFLYYARCGFYDGTIFHRIIPGSVIQGGGYSADGISKWPRRGGIINEAPTGLYNLPYTIAMARISDHPDSATSEFFINLKNNPTFNYGINIDDAYCAFGKVVKGRKVVDRIGKIQTETVTEETKEVRTTLPKEIVIIERVTIEDEISEDTEQNPTPSNESATVTENMNNNITENLQNTEETTEKIEWPGPIVRLATNHGNIDIVLFAEEAPKSVENFLRYVREGFYSGTIFHRVIDGFMIQCGGYDEQLESKPRHEEIEYEGKNGLENQLYTVALARSQALDSASSEFFINVVDNPGLNHDQRGPEGGYAVFGRVIDGFSVVDEITQVPVAPRGFHQHVPIEPVIIENAFILENYDYDSGND